MQVVESAVPKNEVSTGPNEGNVSELVLNVLSEKWDIIAISRETYLDNKQALKKSKHI